MVKLVIEVAKNVKWLKNNRIIIYLKIIIRKLDKYIKDKKLKTSWNIFNLNFIIMCYYVERLYFN